MTTDKKYYDVMGDEREPSELEAKFDLLAKRVSINLQASIMLLNEAKDLIANEPERYRMSASYEDVCKLGDLVDDAYNAANDVSEEIGYAGWRSSSMDC